MILLDPSARPLIAHRGASDQFPENTLLAFKQGLAQGADGLELDVRATADGVPVVIHDATLDRTTDGHGAVSHFTLQELARVDAGRGERIPTFDQVLEQFPDAPLIVELKEAGVGPAVADALRHHNAIHRVLTGSFYGAALKPFAPPFHRAASRGETAWFWGGARLGWGARGAYAAFTVPEYHGRLHVVDEAFVRAATRQGKPVHVWTVNRVRDGERLRVMGVAGIITDCPETFTRTQAS